MSCLIFILYEIIIYIFVFNILSNHIWSAYHIKKLISCTVHKQSNSVSIYWPEHTRQLVPYCVDVDGQRNNFTGEILQHLHRRDTSTSSQERYFNIFTDKNDVFMEFVHFCILLQPSDTSVTVPNFKLPCHAHDSLFKPKGRWVTWYI